jgi:signal peptidase I
MVWYLILAVVGLGLLAAAGWLRWRLRIVTVRGASMQPTLTDGDRLLVRRVRLERVHAGDIVVLSTPAQAGDQPSSADFDDTHPLLEEAAELPIVEDGLPDDAELIDIHTGPTFEDWWLIKRAVAVAGDPVPAEVASARGIAFGTPVPPGALVVLGDNRGASSDSRIFGYVTDGDLLGVVLRPFGNTTLTSSELPAYPR